MIYNQGIEDRIATLESEMKDDRFMRHWIGRQCGLYKVIVSEYEIQIIGWAFLNQ